jgi:hypothetical protein
MCHKVSDFYAQILITESNAVQRYPKNGMLLRKIMDNHAITPFGELKARKPKQQ